MENVDNKYSIHLKETVPKQQGAYKVKAINEAGEMTAMAKLKVKRKANISFPLLCIHTIV